MLCRFCFSAFPRLNLQQRRGYVKALQRKVFSVSNPKVAKAFADNLRSDSIDNKSAGLCAGYARECVTDALGADIANPAGMTARQAFAWYKKRGYHVPRERGSVVGDLLFKVSPGAGKFGHVGGRITMNRVAENSTVHGISEARGIRTLAAFGDNYEIIRLPLPGVGKV